jgi:hypothetical protein
MTDVRRGEKMVVMVMVVVMVVVMKLMYVGFRGGMNRQK